MSSVFGSSRKPVVYCDKSGDLDCCLQCYEKFSSAAQRTLPNLEPVYSWEERLFTPDRITCDFCSKTAEPSKLDVAVALVQSGFSVEHIRKACSNFEWPIDMQTGARMKEEEFCQRLGTAGYKQSTAEVIVKQEQKSQMTVQNSFQNAFPARESAFSDIDRGIPNSFMMHFSAFKQSTAEVIVKQEQKSQMTVQNSYQNDYPAREPAVGGIDRVIPNSFMAHFSAFNPNDA